MKLSQFKKHLGEVSTIEFTLPNGAKVPTHFHVTEVGQITKNFMDCGGTIRNEKVVSFQLWEANDLDHRLAPEKLQNIITLSEEKLRLEDAEIEVEYQGETIGKYGLEFNGAQFELVNQFTNCLADDQCGIPVGKQKLQLRELKVSSNTCCTPESGCC